MFLLFFAYYWRNGDALVALQNIRYVSFFSDNLCLSSSNLALLETLLH